MNQAKQKMNNKQVFFLLVVFIYLAGLSGCSSLPKKMEPRSLVFAQMKTRVARAAQQQGDYARALALYGEAYRYYTGIDDVNGKIEAGLSIARQYFYLDQPDETEKWVDRVSSLIESGFPQMAVARSLLLIEMAFAREEYPRVIALATEVNTGNLEWQMEIDGSVMVAKAKLKQDYRQEFTRLLAGLAELHGRFEKRRLGDPEVLSQGYYHAGYIYSLEENWQTALGYFENAKKVDGLIDNAYGLGNDLYSLGRCYEKLGEPKKAKSHYTRAAEIFILLKDDSMVKKAQERAGALPN